MTGHRRYVVGLIALTLAAAGCGSGSSDPPATTTTESSPPVAGCTAESIPSPVRQQFPAEPPVTVTRTTYIARIVTTCGQLTLTMDAAKAPRTVNSFQYLAGKRFFDGSRCHRLTTAGIYVLQCGDPTGTGSGAPAIPFRMRT